ncbi:MAG: hypothetical protein IPI19_11290 [Ignavibacteriales bacterium]|nr:hypothetical protein [Ignavibacteriales bacterium]
MISNGCFNVSGVSLPVSFPSRNILALGTFDISLTLPYSTIGVVGGSWWICLAAYI